MLKNNYFFCNYFANGFKDILYNNIMYNQLILGSYLFGSFYLFSTALETTNRALMGFNKVPYGVLMLNGLTMLVSGSLIVFNNFTLSRSLKMH